MSLSYTISIAEKADEFTISKLHAIVFSPDLISNLLFPDDPYHDAQTAWTLELFQRAEAEPDARCLKAVETATNRIIGAAMLQTKPPQTPPAAGGPFRSIQNPEFFNAYFPQANPIYQEYYGDYVPASWGSLVVHPDYQRKGVGTALLRCGLHELEMRRERVRVNAMYPVQGLYARFGWKKLGETIVDMSEWKGEGRGYGIYKNVLMAREPDEEAQPGKDV